MEVTVFAAGCGLKYHYFLCHTFISIFISVFLICDITDKEFIHIKMKFSWYSIVIHHRAYAYEISIDFI